MISVRLEKYFHIFLIALFMFILGVQCGIHHGRKLQAEDLGVEYTAPWEVPFDN